MIAVREAPVAERPQVSDRQPARAKDVEHEVEVKADRGQYAGLPGRVGAEHGGPDHEQSKEQTVPRCTMRDEIGVLAPEDADAVEVEHDAGQHHEPSVAPGS